VGAGFSCAGGAGGAVGGGFWPNTTGVAMVKRSATVAADFFMTSP
jgi:hypothetical protein